MKNYSIIVAGIITFFLLSAGTMYHTGTPGGKTGSPSDGSSCTQCHSGTPLTGTSWISSNIPETGYEPGNVYIITIQGSHTGAQRYGFELTAENASNEKVGKFEVIMDTQTQLTNITGNAITHTNMGIMPVAGQAEWNCQWIAPEAGAGQVTFYAAINAANGNGTTSGDIIYLDNKAYNEKVEIVSISEARNKPNILVFPNPTSDFINIQINELTINTISLIDIQGKMQILNFPQNQESFQINLNSMAKGIYWLNIQTENSFFSEKLILQ